MNQFSKNALKNRFVKLSLAAVAAAGVGGCLGGGSNTSRFANPASSFDNLGHSYMAPRPSAAGPSAQFRGASPLAGRVIDSAPIRVNRCNASTGQVYDVRVQKIINLRGDVDVVEIPLSMQTGMFARRDPLRCGFINSMAQVSIEAYRAGRGSGYGGLYNRVPVIR